MSVSFSPYSADEVRLSVVKVTNPLLETGDPGSALSDPAPGGLYDPSLGPLNWSTK